MDDAKIISNGKKIEKSDDKKGANPRAFFAHGGHIEGSSAFQLNTISNGD